MGDFANNRAYGGIDVERVVKSFKKGGITDLVKPLGRGATGRTIAKNWKERKAMMQVMRNPENGKAIAIKMTDKRWPMNDGWVKKAKNIDGVEIHWVRNERTGQVDDFKFKN